MKATLTINLANIIKNYKAIKKFVGQKVQVAPAVKCNAYGLGMEPIARALYENGCNEFYVARLEEGIKLRKLIKDCCIYVIDGITKGEEELFLKANLIPVLNNQEQIDCWIAYSKQNKKKLTCCVHIDSGMTRLGIDPYLADKVLNALAQTKYVQVAYVLSHLACSDEPTSAMNQKQLEFMLFLKQKFPQFKYSFANSDGISLNKKYHFDQVRPGIIIYGGNKKYLPTVQLTAPIIDIHRIQKNDLRRSVGYGATHQLSEGTVIATIPIGYGDGYFRRLGNQGYCFINDMKVNIVGRISMDLLCLDISNVSRRLQKIGTKVEIIGKHISIEEIASLADTINYEVLTALGNRYERIYINRSD